MSVQISQEHMREKDQQDAPLSYYSFQLNYPLHVSNKQVDHQEVISVHAAYSIYHASIGCLAANIIVS
jgi:hypothetical protein